MCYYIRENYCFYEIIFSKLFSFCFQDLELLSCNYKQFDNDCLCSSHGLICTDVCSCKHCKNSNEEGDEGEHFDIGSESENDSESYAEY